jgi:5'-methylthioadenosine phosphorylase
MIDIGIITGSGIYRLTGDPESHHVETRFGEAEVAVTGVGPWNVGVISRHGTSHHHLPHTVPHQANLTALKQLGARAVLATTAVGVVDPGIPLGRPILFDDLFFPENLLPNGTACTIFTEPGDPRRAHLIRDEPFAPRLRRKMELAADNLGLEATAGGVYAHTNGPRFETRSEIRWLNSVGVAAVSQTCGPEVVLAGELELPYGLAGFPVNYATGVAQPESEQELSRLLALSAKTLARLILRTVEVLEEQDLVYDHGFLYRVEGGIGHTEVDAAPGAAAEESWGEANRTAHRP